MPLAVKKDETFSEGDEDRGNMDRHGNHVCLYCRKKFKMTYTHFSRYHQDKARVSEIMKMEDSARKRRAWEKLVEEGDRVFNTTNGGDDKTSPKTVKESNAITGDRRYFTCSNCLGRIRTSYRRSHENICGGFLQEEEANEREGGSTLETQAFHRSIVDGLKEDVVRKLTGNKSIYKFILRLWEEKGTRHRSTIREKMKTCLILQDKLQEKLNTTTGFKSFFKTKFVDYFLAAIKELSGIEFVDNEIFFRVPTKAQRLCRTTEQFGRFLKMEYLKKGNDQRSKELENFLFVFNYDAKIRVRNIASKTLRVRKLRARVEPPKSKDVSTLLNQLKEETDELLEAIKREKDKKTWRSLAENILLRLTIFNRRRGRNDAAERMKLEDFRETRDATETFTDGFVRNLKQEEERHFIVEMRPDWEKITSVYIDAELKNAVETLIEYRNDANISEENSYVFAAGRGSASAIPFAAVASKYKKVCPPELRNALVAIIRRKQSARAPRVLEVTVEDLKEWAMYMRSSISAEEA